MAVCGVDNIYVSPYDRARGRGKQSLGLGASRVFMRVGTFWASDSWTREEGKGGTESKSKGDSASGQGRFTVSRRALSEEGRQGCVFIYAAEHLFDNERVS